MTVSVTSQVFRLIEPVQGSSAVHWHLHTQYRAQNSVSISQRLTGKLSEQLVD